MKHIFIMNPAAGNGRGERLFLPQIIETAKAMGISYEIHRTLNSGDAFRFIKGRCLERDSADEVLRFYACGGDGTLNEAASGVFGQQRAEIAVIPAGTGNDFVRNFQNRESFVDVSRQILGVAQQVDLIQYKLYRQDSVDRKSEGGGSRGERNVDSGFCINMINAGLECDVVDRANRFKQSISAGPLVYAASAAASLIKKRNICIGVKCDDGAILNGEYLMLTVAGGSFCGGGFCGAPRALLDDGLMDVSLVKDMSRRCLLRLAADYRKGSHLDHVKAAEFITYKQCKKIEITSSEELKLCVDGEILMAKDMELSILPGALSFSVPV